MSAENLYAILYETLQLALQFVGALFIARKAVGWALGRYKREKHWERKLQAFSEVLSASGTMNQILTQWIRNEERREPVPSVSDENAHRYQAATQKLEETAAVAALILAPEVDRVLQTLLNDLDKAGRNADRAWLTALEEEQSILIAAREQLLELGKRDLAL